ncbi:uncharacterized protein LOC117082609 [Trachypithecus francoisi]|uniref:uncharacterized protein LOC117082609 n=1 Tax=Trachypithecus francoisi TaxID=54180 RepID=UPI00141BD168|nr:uncharacterized protein LOC117082609 [Trachypithecus francoisi]
MGLVGVGKAESFYESTFILPCAGPDGQKGTIQPYIMPIPINLWGRVLVAQWGAEINISHNSYSAPSQHMMENMGFVPGRVRLGQRLSGGPSHLDVLGRLPTHACRPGRSGERLALVLAMLGGGLGIPRRTRPTSPSHRSGGGNTPGSRSGPRRLRAQEPREAAGPRADSAAAISSFVSGSGKQRPPPATVVGEKKGARRPGLLPATPREHRASP